MAAEQEPMGWSQVRTFTHDVNNIITAIIGLCDLILMDHGDDVELSADIMEIRNNASRIEELTGRLRALSDEGES
jgi:two-component system cell cycle sensor histidine kinase/response regulator CckA